jgi:hypothetical protein
VRAVATVALAGALLGLSGCSAEYVRECNSVKRTVDPIVSRIDAEQPPNDMANLRLFVGERADDYSVLAERLESLQVNTPELASSLKEYAEAARRYAGEARLYVAGLDQHSPEQINVARERAAVEHGHLVTASRGVATWCEPFGP